MGMWARKKNPQDLRARFSSLYPRKKSTRFVGEIFTRFSSLSPRKKNLQDLWDYFLGSKINKICGPHILLIFFLQEKWIYPQDSHVSCPRNSKISLEELYRPGDLGPIKIGTLLFYTLFLLLGPINLDLRYFVAKTVFVITRFSV